MQVCSWQACSECDPGGLRGPSKSGAAGCLQKALPPRDDTLSFEFFQRGLRLLHVMKQNN